MEWIGKVVRIEGKTFYVRITYSRDGAYGVGKVTMVSTGDFQKLEKVSGDAVLKGWR